MTEFEKILEQCLLDLEMGIANVDECISRYPGHAPQLGPVLLTHTSLARLGEARPSAAFKARVRARLTQEMKAHPRKSSRFSFAFMRLATNFAVIVLMLLLAGTAYAQSALPGNVFHGWKLASENAWRAVSSDPIGTDLAIAERRVDELIAVGNDPALRSQALEAYLEVTARLKSEMDAANEARILQALDSQIEELNESGIPVPQIIDEEVLPQLDEPSPTLVEPVMTLPPVTEIPQVNPTSLAPAVVPTELPQVVDPTNLPEIVPTIQALPEIVSTVQVSPNIIPTIQVPKLFP
jgi:hypothetical protein